MASVSFPSGVAALDRLAKNGAALSVLLRMTKQEVMNPRDFEKASRLPTKKARALREAMQEMALITAKVVGRRGVVDIWEIRPTRLGKQLMQICLEMNALMELASKGAPESFDDDI